MAAGAASVEIDLDMASPSKRLRDEAAVLEAEAGVWTRGLADRTDSTGGDFAAAALP
jgi:hypothetical protein